MENQLFSDTILGVRVNFGFTYASIIDKIEHEFLTDGKTHRICTTNPEFILAARKDPEFKELLNTSDLSVPDGFGVILAERYRQSLKTGSKDGNNIFGILHAGLRTVYGSFTNGFGNYGTVTGYQLFLDLCKVASEKGYSICLLGGQPRDSKGNLLSDAGVDTARECADLLRKKFPGLIIVTATSQFSTEENSSVILERIKHDMRKLNIISLDFLFVAANYVRQEKWIYANAPLIPAKVAIGVGGTFDYVTGSQKRPHSFITSLHLEWLNRFIHEPWRYKRIVSAIFEFPRQVLLDSVARSNNEK